MNDCFQQLFQRAPQRYHQILELRSNKNGQSIIQLKKGILRNDEMDDFICKTRQECAQFIRKQIHQFKLHGINYETSFILQLHKDQITREKIQEFPILINENQNIVLDPIFCEQVVYMEYLSYTQFDQAKIDYFFEQLVITLKFWEILQTIQKQNDEIYHILMLPNQCNFAIVNEMGHLFFNNSENQKYQFLELNSVFINQEQESINYLRTIFKQNKFIFFNKYSSDEIVKNGYQIQYYDQKQQVNVTIAKRPFDIIHSTLCGQDSHHQITFEKNKFPTCKICNIVIDQDNYDTLYVSLTLYSIYMKIQEILWISKSNIEKRQLVQEYYIPYDLKSINQESIVENFLKKFQLIDFPSQEYNDSCCKKFKSAIKKSQDDDFVNQIESRNDECNNMIETNSQKQQSSSDQQKKLLHSNTFENGKSYFESKQICDDEDENEFLFEEEYEISSEDS